MKTSKTMKTAQAKQTRKAFHQGQATARKAGRPRKEEATAQATPKTQPQAVLVPVRTILLDLLLVLCVIIAFCAAVYAVLPLALFAIGAFAVIWLIRKALRAVRTYRVRVERIKA